MMNTLKMNVYLSVTCSWYIHINILEEKTSIIFGSLETSASCRNEYWDYDCGTTNRKWLLSLLVGLSRICSAMAKVLLFAFLHQDHLYPHRMFSSPVKLEAAPSSKMWVPHIESTWRHIPQDSDFYIPYFALGGNSIFL